MTNRRETLAPNPWSTSKRLIFTGLLAASSLLFVALGIWQMERRTHKLSLIAAVDQRLRQPPGAAPGPAKWPRINFNADAYRPIEARGRFLHDEETLVRATTKLGAGYWVLTPLVTGAGWIVLVNRGFVPPENRNRAVRRAGEPRGAITVVGLLRTTELGGTLLSPNDPLRDRWYSRDVAAIGHARHLASLAPYFIDARTTESKGQPVGGLTVVSFANNHLQYALTWFALAAVAAFGIVSIWRGSATRADV